MLLRALSVLAILCSAPARAEPVEVDIELFLAVDVSRSMSPDELEIQRRGYAAALTSDEVLGAIGDGMLGRIAITYVEWAGATSQNVVVPWTLIESRAQAEAIAASLTADFSASMRRTSISGALDFGRASIDGNDFKGLRRVIDVSGDGPNNDGVPVTEARDRALADGIVINGLPLMTNTGLGYRFEHLDLYYRDCVIGGPGAFMIPVTDWEQFAPAVRRKIVLELAGAPPLPRLIPVQATAPTDCMVGEKMRRQRDQFFNNP
jgi:hypothetical protein